jgi:tetratricopeptide (TPR) repeat protein
VSVQGKPLPAGSYGLHFIPGADEWTIIFSKNHTSWGSYFYDPKEDALRVTAKPEKSEYTEWLTYEFTDRQADKATVALKWEELQVPFTVSVTDIDGVYMSAIRNELRSSPGFNPRNREAAAQFALQRKANLQEALTWAEQAAQPPTGQESFSSLAILAQLQEANGKADDARKTMDRAMNHPSAAPMDLHQYGRQLQQQKKNEEALKVFELNAKRFPDTWPVQVGLARGYAALGRNKEALAAARAGLAKAPNDQSRTNLETLIKQIEEGKYVN